MSDTWTCSLCKVKLRCSCQSQECGFDYDIKHHVRQDLRKAIELNAQWYEIKPREMVVFLKRILLEIDNG
jgi:hypothetical protein